MPTFPLRRPSPLPDGSAAAPRGSTDDVDPHEQPLLLRWGTDAVVVVLRGDIDIAARGRLAAVRDVVVPWSSRTVVDAAEVTFLDVAGLRAVLALAGDGGPVEVRAASTPFRRLLDLLATTGTSWGLAVTGPPDRLVLAPGSPAVAAERDGP